MCEQSRVSTGCAFTNVRAAGRGLGAPTRENRLIGRMIPSCRAILWLVALSGAAHGVLRQRPRPRPHFCASTSRAAPHAPRQPPGSGEGDPRLAEGWELYESRVRYAEPQGAKQTDLQAAFRRGIRRTGRRGRGCNSRGGARDAARLGAAKTRRPFRRRISRVGTDHEAGTRVGAGGGVGAMGEWRAARSGRFTNGTFRGLSRLDVIAARCGLDGSTGGSGIQRGGPFDRADQSRNLVSRAVLIEQCPWTGSAAWPSPISG